MPSTGAVGFRVTLPTGGEMDSLGWIDSSAAAPDDMVALGESDWDVSDPTGDSGRGVTTWAVGGSDVRVEESGVTVIDRRGDTQSDTWLESGVGIGGYSPGTYDIVLWGATSSPGATTRFRLHVPADATLVDETTSSSAFLRTQRQFTGTAGATVDAQPVTATVPVGAELRRRSARPLPSTSRPASASAAPCTERS